MLRRLFALAAAIVVAAAAAFAATTPNPYAKPDFAFPTKVAAEARAALDEALAHGDGQLALRSLMNMSVALTEVDGDSAATVLAAVRRASALLPQASDRALVDLLAAKIYYALYQQRRYDYDRREQPAEPTADYRLWSGQQWRDSIVACVDDALSNPELLVATRLADYGKMVTTDRRIAAMYPTVLDFVASQATDLLQQLGVADILPLRMLCAPSDFMAQRIVVQKPLAQRILNVYATWIGLSAQRPDALLAAELSRLKFVEGNVYRGGVNQVERRLYSALYSLWADHRGSPYAAEALIEAYGSLYGDNTPLSTVKQYIAACNEQVKAHKDYFRNGWLERYVALLKQPQVAINYPESVAPGDSLPIAVTLRNARDFTIYVYAAPYSWGNRSRSFEVTASSRSRLRLVESIHVAMADSVAPFRSQLVRTIALAEPGTYIVGAAFPGQAIEEGSYTYVHCSSLRLGSLSFAGQAWPFAVHTATGAPFEGVTLQGYDNSRKFKLVDTQTTAADGMARMADDARVVFASKGSDRFAKAVGIGSYYSKPTPTYSVQGFTSLPLYHLGDTVEWAAVAQSTLMQECKPLAARKVQAVLYDANRQAVDTIVATTDRFGRIEGRFPLPAEGLTGNFHIRFTLADRADDEQMRWSALYIKVSDYKLPTYLVEVADIERNVPAPGDVTITGRATTYSGFPVANAAVAVNLSAGGRRWWCAPVSFASLADTTDGEGRFTVVCTDALLAGAPVDGGVFTADITVTSPNGENRTATTAFSLGKPLMLRASLANVNIDATKPLRLDLSLTTPNGVSREAALSYELLRSDSTVALSGTFPAASPAIDLSAAQSGVYDIRIAPVDTALAEPVSIEDVVLYRPTDTSAPDPAKLLWLPTRSATIPATGGIDMLYATTADSTWVLYVVTAADSIVGKGWLCVGPGMHCFTYPLPDHHPTATLLLAATLGNRSTTERIGITRQSVVSSLDIAIESFRDRIAPGDTEQWTLRVGAGKSGLTPGATAMLLDVYNKAIDAIAPHSFAFTPRRSSYPTASLNIDNGLDRLVGARSKSIGRFICLTLPQLDFVTWDRPLVASTSVRMISRAYGARAVNELKMAKADAVEDAVMDSGGAMETRFDSAMLAFNLPATDDAEVVADEQEAAGVASDDTGGDTGGDDFAYRDAETPLALFAPMLTTDADGSLRVDFTAPNANATWMVRAIAYSADMIAGNAVRQMVASKPVMVQPLLPRFLRQGDRAELRATLMNAADTAATVAVRVELFDPTDGTILLAEDYLETIASGGSATIATDVAVAADALMLGYRIKATMGRYADGEQTVMPVLAAAQPVVETTPFYIPADSLHYAVKLPKMGKEARVTLQFCENPAWYVATALPGLRAGEHRDALSTAAALFSAAVADGLLRDQPAIADALRQWTASDRSDSTLTSMLQRNADLKIALLGATPWAMDARSQSERMQRLALLFAPGEVEAAYASAIAMFGKLQQADGGMAWTALYAHSSLWATENVLLTLGRLKQMGYLPSNQELNAIISKALAYMDRSVAQRAREHRDATDVHYVYIRSFYPDVERPGECDALTSRTVAQLLRTWRDMTVGSKAVAALIFKAQGHAAAASQVVASLSDFAVTTPERGMWWPSLDSQSWWSMGKVGTTALILDAFAAVDPAAPAIDLIRQWLILQKETTDWGTSAATSQAIASILRTGSQWTRPATPVAIAVGKQRVVPDGVEALLGEMRVDISALKPSGKTLTVDKQQTGPSWGAVVSQYVGDMATTEAAASADLAIEKRLYRRVATADGEQWVEADTLRVGDVVQTNLVITASRDLEYVAIIDNRAACLEPVDQLPTPLWAEGLCFYRENRDSATDIFITRLPKGTYRLSYHLNVAQAGTFASGLASIQSQYAPAVAAHSAGTLLHSRR